MSTRISSLIFTHVNTNRFGHKCDFTDSRIKEKTINIFVITDMKIGNFFTNTQFQVPRYVIYRQDLSSTKVRGYPT